MSVTRWDPFYELRTLRDEMNRIFSETFSRLHGTPPETSSVVWEPAVDIIEQDDEFVVHADAPGFDPKDIEIDVTQDSLEIRGTSKQIKEERSDGDGRRSYIRSERRYGSFTRSFRLPTPIVPDKAKASYRNGVLEIHLPKAEEAKTKPVRLKPS